MRSGTRRRKVTPKSAASNVRTTDTSTDDIRTEHEEQREFVQWFRREYPGVRIFAVPNGEQRSPSVACRLKTEGVMRGVPDLFVPAWGLWIEMKRTKGGVVSVEQTDWIEYLQGLGYAAVVCRGCDEAKAVAEKHRREVVSQWRV